jgi:hypothetical protein
MAIAPPTEPKRKLADEIAWRIQRLGALTADLNKAATLEEVADTVLRHGIQATRAIGGVMVLVRGEGQALEVVGLQGTDTHVLAPVKRYDLKAHIPLVTAARTGQAVFLASTEEFQRHYPRVLVPRRDLALGCMPLLRAGIHLGAVGFVFDGEHSFGPTERAFMHSLSRSCLDALQRSRVLEKERMARRGAENAAARLERLQRVTAGLNRALSLEEIVEIVADQAVEGTGARACFVAVWQDGAPKIVAEVGVTKEALARGRVAFQRCLPQVAISGEPLWPESDADEDVDAALRSTSKNKLACIPVRMDSHLICALGVKLGKRGERQSVRMFLTTLASLCGQAIERARLYETEREARARAERANRLKDEFLGIVSHELRTPLTAISCWIELLRRRPPKPDEFERAIESIARNTAMQARLVEDLLDTSRIVSDKLRLEIEEVSLPELLESARQALAQDAAGKQIDLRVVLPENPLPHMRGDSVRLDQVVRNLVSNAVKFTPPEGRVELRLSSAGKAARIEVIDTGEGIAPELLPHVFERFRQGDGSSLRRHGGLGLGLAIVKHLVEAHGGRVSAHSDGQDKGTRMTVELPLERAKAGREDKGRGSTNGAASRKVNGQREV